jgi:hypothetical protein
MRHGLEQTDKDAYSFVISRAAKDQITWNDIPDGEIVGEALGRAARFAVAWLNNISLELDAAQLDSMATFLSGAPWARHFFQPTGKATGSQAGRPSIRDTDELSLKAAIDAYSETLLQWLNQFSSNTGSGFNQQLFTAKLLKRNTDYENSLDMVVCGPARPTREERQDTVEDIKYRIDDLSADQIPINGVAGLADILWSLSR